MTERLAEVAVTAGLLEEIAWHTGSTFGDYDSDGDLDLYVAGYVDIHSLDLYQPAPVCRYLDLPVFCGLRQLKGERDIVYRNNGDGTFTDVTDLAQVKDEKAYYGFTPVFDDLNDDGRPDHIRRQRLLSQLFVRCMHLTPETPTYSMRGCGGLPADAGGV